MSKCKENTQEQILISQNFLFIFVYTIQKIYYNLKYTLFPTDLLFSKYINIFRQHKVNKKCKFYRKRIFT